MRRVVLLLSQDEPVICDRRSTPPGPVKLAMSAAILKLAGAIACVKVRSIDDTGAPVATLKLCEATRGFSRAMGMSVATVTVVAEELASTALYPSPRRAKACQICN